MGTCVGIMTGEGDLTTCFHFEKSKKANREIVMVQEPGLVSIP